ncbi:sigma-54 interaction domain-containing protein [Alicyclobacillus mali (ex Roth et al. 2021)]|uniref:sigma-54 interaction domain-containing protein n=1 Tax=Alicyclobacillus mali (ex Roth et al. 2021) TaxID=1123961 RepID=UPI00082B7993|nr:sigma 54-interacting transcriptional regulator [Alicyclobacillus mali (ex Roth et al. 2021)]
MQDWSWMEHLTVPILIFERGQLARWNQAAHDAWPFLEQGFAWDDFRSSWTGDWIVHLHPWSNGESFLVECHPDLTRPVAERLQEMREAYEELELIFSEAFDEVFVTDGKGITIRVNRAAERLYGLRQEDLIGRSVFDLERRGVFYPSVIGLALKLRRQVTVLQTTSDGTQLWATANPVFDSSGEIRLVISTAKEISDIVRPDAATPEPMRREADGDDQPPNMVAHSPGMRRVFHIAKRVARTDISCLLLGETGVGKSTLAEWIHRISPRQHGPFVQVNCAALPDSLLESELFGYESGAFTGALKSGKPGKVELANGGTLFLDEIAEVPLHLQGKLLDFVERRVLTRIGGTRVHKVDARIIAATNRDLKQMVRDGRFRADLYYRLTGVEIEIPPLRNRKEDIPEIVQQLLRQVISEFETKVRRVHPAVIRRLEQYSWPGNVRELEHLIRRLVILSDGDCILLSDLRDEWIDEVPPSEASSSEGPLAQLAQLERALYADAASRLRTTYEIAEALGVSQSTVVRKLKKYGLSIKRM